MIHDHGASTAHPQPGVDGQLSSDHSSGGHSGLEHANIALVIDVHGSRLDSHAHNSIIDIPAGDWLVGQPLDAAQGPSLVQESFPNATVADGISGWHPGIDIEPYTFQEPSNIYGTPEIDRFYWQQQTTGFDCAVMAQRGIINEFTGANLSEAELVYEATANHWLTDHGTSPQDVTRLLEKHGVACHAVEHASMGQLMGELALGHKLIVGVEAEELWDPHHPLHAFTSQAANHAIWVTGIDMHDPNHPRIIINDSGDPAGCGSSYDLGTFLNAWHASGYAYVATNQAPPGLAANCGDFRSESGTFANLVESVREHTPDFLAAANPSRTETVGLPSVTDFGWDKPNDLFSQKEHAPLFGGYSNADGTYHWDSDNTDRDPQTGAIVRRW